MPRTKLQKLSEKKSSSDSVNETISILEEGKARVMLGKKEIVVDALHALSVLTQQGGDVLDINIDVDTAAVFCDNYEIPYSKPPTKSALTEAIKKRF